MLLISALIQDQPLWLIMYANDIALIDENRLMLECKVNLQKCTIENGDFKPNMSKTEYPYISHEPAVTLDALDASCTSLEASITMFIKAAWANGGR